MKIKLHSHCYINIVFIIFLSFLFSACGGSSSENSGNNGNGSGNGQQKLPDEKVTTIQGENVSKTLDEAKKTVVSVVSGGAKVTLMCKCDDRIVSGRGTDEGTARTKAQEACTKLGTNGTVKQGTTISDCNTPTPATT